LRNIYKIFGSHFSEQFVQLRFLFFADPKKGRLARSARLSQGEALRRNLPIFGWQGDAKRRCKTFEANGSS